MTQAEVEQWIEQNGGPSSVQYAVEQKSVKNPAFDPYNDAAGPQYITIPVETWKNSKTGAVLSARRGEGGVFTLWESATADPNKPNQQATVGRVEGTPIPGQKNPDGSQAYDNSKPIWVERDPGNQQVGPARGLTATERAQWEKDTGRAQGQTARAEVPGHPGIFHVISKDANGNTDDHHEDANGNRVAAPTETASSDEPYKGYPGWIVRTTVNNGVKRTVYINPQGQEAPDPSPAANASKDTPSEVTRNGKTYIKHTTIKADGTAGDIYYTDQGGNRVQLPDESKPGSMVTIDGRPFWATPNADPSKAPTLTPMDPGGNVQPKDNGPQFAPGMAPSDYLTARRQWWMDQRRAGVSQKEVDDGWGRDVQVATARQNEENTAASQQNQRLSSSMTGFNQATSAVENINKYLPPGSDLGGRAFEAMLGLQRAQAERMGGYGPVGGRPAALTVPAAPSAAVDPTSQVAAVPPPPAADIPGVRTGAAMTGTGVDPPPVVPPTAPVTAPAGVSPPSGPPPTPGEPGGPPLQTTYPVWQPPTVPKPSALPPADEFGRTPASGGAVTPSPTLAPVVGPSSELGQPGDPTLPLPNPVYGGPGPSRTNDPGIYRELPAIPGSSPPVPLPGEPPGGWPDTGLPPPVPLPDYPGRGSGQAPFNLDPQQGPVGSTPELPVMARARIASTPPWRLTEDDYRRAQAMGMPEHEFWSVPRLRVGA